MTIDLSADLEAALTRKAQRLGTTPTLLVEQAVREKLQLLEENAASLPNEVSQKLNRLLAVARPCGAALSNEQLSRESLYE